MVFHEFSTYCTQRRTSYSQNADKSFKRRSDFLDETLTVTPVPTHRPTLTQTLLQQRLHRTSEAPLKLTIARLLQLYDIRVAHKPIRRLHVLANVKAIKTVRRTEKEHYTKIKCCDCRTTYIQVRPEETLARD